MLGAPNRHPSLKSGGAQTPDRRRRWPPMDGDLEGVAPGVGGSEKAASNSGVPKKEEEEGEFGGRAP